MLTKLKALFAKLRDLWSSHPLLQKSVTIPTKLILIGAAVAVVLLVAGAIHRSAQPTVNSLLGVKEPKVPAEIGAYMEGSKAFQKAMLAWAPAAKADIIAACRHSAKPKNRAVKTATR